jgi:hypothetical protein
MARIKSHPFMGRRVCVPLYRPDEVSKLTTQPPSRKQKHPTGSKNTQLGAKTPNWEFLRITEVDRHVSRHFICSLTNVNKI